ncbi:MAG: ribonuclease, partial [Frankiaceae bacterium]|nr:ribonuclease [Frankiaceae bacterium]
MLDDERDTTSTTGTSGTSSDASTGDAASTTPTPRKRAPRKTAAQKTTTGKTAAPKSTAQPSTTQKTAASKATKATTKTATGSRRKTAAAGPDSGGDTPTSADESSSALTEQAQARSGVPGVLFQPPEPTAPPRKAARKTTAKKTSAAPPANEEAPARDAATSAEPADGPAAGGEPGESTEGGDRPARRRRGRRGRGGGGGGGGRAAAAGAAGDGERDAADGERDTDEQAPVGIGDAGGADDRDDAADGDDADDRDDAGGDGQADGEGGSATRRRRRRRRRRTGDGSAEGEVEAGEDDDEGVETVVHVREARPAQKSTQKTAQKSAAARGGRSSGGGARGGEARGGEADDDGVRGVKGSTRLEAKRQRRRDGRDTGRRRPPIITESEFLARRESVERVMVVRQADDRTQIAVLEDGVLVEHYVARKDQTSMVGNVYLGKVQNVLPSMEAAFVDIGRGRNAVLYAGEVNYDASALEGRPPRIEQALKTSQSVLVQVTKDPIGHKGSRLTSQVSLPGRYMVYVPDGRLSGISRKLPDTERSRLKGILKRLTPEDAGVIIRTAAEGASEEDLERDLNRLHAQWQDIEKKAQTASAPALIYAEPDVVIRVIRDIFNEDFKELVVSGADEWDTVDNYIRWVAPDLAERTRRWTDDEDVFAAYRVDEQLAKALDRKVWLPSGGYLVIDRTEAMIVVDVNTGKFTGKGGGNLEETVTKNNIEAAEEIVRQLRLRDLGGIIVIDFIDMVLESNRDLVLRRLIECLGRDRTRHQVAEVTSLGL